MPSLSRTKAIGLLVVWIITAGAIAVTLAVIVTEVLWLLGFVDPSSSGYEWSLRIVTFVGWLLLAAVPYFFRDRFVHDPEQDE